MKIAHALSALIFVLSFVSPAFAAKVSCRAALSSSRSFAERLSDYHVQKKRDLTEFEIEEVLEAGSRSLIKEVDSVSQALQDNPDAVTLLHEIEMINVGTESVLSHAKTLSSQMDQGRLRKMFQKEGSRELKMQELAEEIRVCRSQTEACMTDVQAKVTVVIEAAQKMGELVTRIDATIEELKQVSAELPIYREGIGSFITRLQLMKSVFEGYLAAVEKGFPTLHDAEIGFKTLVDTLVLLAERGAPSIIVETLSPKDLRAQHEAKIHLQFLKKVSPEILKGLKVQKDPEKIEAFIFGQLLGPRLSDADVLYMLQRFPRFKHDRLPYLFDSAMGFRIGYGTEKGLTPSRKLPDREWSKVVEVFDGLVDYYIKKDDYHHQQQKTQFRQFYAKTLSNNRTIGESP